MSTHRRRADYGFDAPYVPALMTLGASPLAWGAIAAATRGDLVGAGMMGASATLLVACAGSFLYTTRRGKFAVWRALLDELGLRGDERVLDVGCGRGAVLNLVAARLSTGSVTGVDLWRTKDQSGNAPEVTLRNAELEGVRDRVHLETGDMRELPFEDERFDVVLSSLAVHNLPDRAERAKALREMVRVLKRGGRILIADFKHRDEYAATLREARCDEIVTSGLGARFWYGGPWAATTLLRARRAA